jgi:hypothetical protein
MMMIKVNNIGRQVYQKTLRPFCFPHLHNFAFVNDEKPDIYLYVFHTEKNSEYEKEYRDIFMRKYSDGVRSKTVIYLNCDDPSFVRKFADDGPLFFVAQSTPELLGLDRVITIPLMMGSASVFYNTRYRKTLKDKDFIFIGNTSNHEDRKRFVNVNRKNIYIKHTPSFYTLDNQHQKIRQFLHSISLSKFGFAPRGSGTSSFRLYEYLMVGTVPIITGMVGYPFDSEVNWDDFSIRGEMDDIEKLIQQAEDMDYETYLQMRASGMRFFDEYCKLDKLYGRLINIIKEKMNV